MALSKHHYVAIAHAMADTSREHCNEHAYQALCELQTRLADFFEADNPAFDRDRFISACNVQSPNLDREG